MAISKEQKVEILKDLTSKFKVAKSIGFAKTNKLSVQEFSNLRNNLREIWADYTLAKKTLIKIALKNALNIEIDLSNLEWQIWVVCSNQDAMSWLWKVNAFIGDKKMKDKIEWAACIFEWEYKNLEDTKAIAWMPSRETLLSRLVWSLQSPLSWLARFFYAAAKELETTWKSKVWELEAKKQEV